MSLNINEVSTLFMGHVDISSTHIYLQATPELFEEANKRFLKHYRQHIKNQGGHS